MENYSDDELSEFIKNVPGLGDLSQEDNSILTPLKGLDSGDTIHGMRIIVLREILKNQGHSKHEKAKNLIQQHKGE